MTAKDFVPVKKMGKRARKAYNAQKRVCIGFNTGTRVHKVDKYPTCAQQKAQLRREAD